MVASLNSRLESNKEEEEELMSSGHRRRPRASTRPTPTPPTPRSSGAGPLLSSSSLLSDGTGPERSLSLKLSDTRVYEPQIRALHRCRILEGMGICETRLAHYSVTACTLHPTPYTPHPTGAQEERRRWKKEEEAPPLADWEDQYGSVAPPARATGCFKVWWDA